MLSRIQLEWQDAKQAVRKSANMGFVATSVRSEPTDINNKALNPARNFTDRVWMETPYTYNGDPLLACCFVEHGHMRIDRSEELIISNAELWTKDKLTGNPDRNLEDVYEEEHGTRNWAVKEQDRGDVFDHEDVEKAVADCAAATVSFPHVMHYDEYKPFYRFGTATPKAYAVYLQHCEGLMRQGVSYVGEVRDPDRVNLLYLEAMPEPDSREIPTIDNDFEEDGLAGPNV